MRQLTLRAIPENVERILYAGFHMGRQKKRNTAELSEFMDLPGVEETRITGAIAERFGMIVASLRKKGTLIPTNDIWIAATALETGVRLLSFDSHFEEIPGLAMIAPDDE